MRAMLVSTSPVVCTFVTLPPCTQSQTITAALPSRNVQTAIATARRAARARGWERNRARGRRSRTAESATIPVDQPYMRPK